VLLPHACSQGDISFWDPNQVTDISIMVSVMMPQPLSSTSMSAAYDHWPLHRTRLRHCLLLQLCTRVCAQANDAPCTAPSRTLVNGVDAVVCALPVLAVGNVNLTVNIAGQVGFLNASSTDPPALLVVCRGGGT
jgi:hypothetical protein